MHGVETYMVVFGAGGAFGLLAAEQVPLAARLVIALMCQFGMVAWFVLFA